VPVLLLAVSSSAGLPAGSLNQTKMVFLNTTNLPGKTAVVGSVLLSSSAPAAAAVLHPIDSESTAVHA
jgi:hypothetical protein